MVCVCVAEREENQKLSEISFSAEGARNPSSLPSAHSTPGRVYCQLFFSAACSSCETSEKAPPRALHLCSSDESKEIAILGRHGAKWQSSLEKQRKKLVLSEERKEERKRGLERISTGCVFFSAPGEKKLDSAPSPSLSLSLSAASSSAGS